MITIRKANERGRANHGWLNTRFTFSFADYYDPKFLGFRALRVLNDDTIAGGGGFPNHPHRDMEIITYVLDGAIAHRDSMGNVAVVAPGEVQRMTAGTGVVHSEFNASPTDTLRLLQIWIEPAVRGLAPSYEQRRFDDSALRGQLRLVASRDGRDGSVTVHQDVDLLAARLGPGERVHHPLGPGRHAWVQLARGAATLGDVPLDVGDGAAISDEAALTLTGRDSEAEILVFDLA